MSGAALVPCVRILVSTDWQARSAQIWTSAGAWSPSRVHESFGRRVVATDVERGAIGRGFGSARKPVREHAAGDAGSRRAASAAGTPERYRAEGMLDPPMTAARCPPSTLNVRPKRSTPEEGGF